jgi:hypothetical protein
VIDVWSFVCIFPSLVSVFVSSEKGASHHHGQGVFLGLRTILKIQNPVLRHVKIFALDNL